MNDIAFYNRTVEVNKAVSVKTVSFVENSALFTKMLFIIQNVFIKRTIQLYITLLQYSHYNVFLFKNLLLLYIFIYLLFEYFKYLIINNKKNFIF